MLDTLALLRAMNGIDEEDIEMAGEIYFADKPMRRGVKRLLTLALAAALLLALGVAAYAVWSIHETRQRQLSENLKIAEHHAESYVEYVVPAGETEGLVLLSAVNDGEEEHVYVNISPVTEEEAAAFPESLGFAWRIEGTDIGGFAAPELPPDLPPISGADAVRNAVLQYAYDRDTQTMTLQCYLYLKTVRDYLAETGADTLPLSVTLTRDGENTARSFGPIDFALTGEQRRTFDFHRAQYYDAALDRTIEIQGLELTPFSAVWIVSYPDAAAFHTPMADWDAYAPWSALEDKVGIESRIWFADSTSFSTGGALTCPYEDGAVRLNCGWGAAIDIDAVQRITLGNVTLWQTGM